MKTSRYVAMLMTLAVAGSAGAQSEQDRLLIARAAGQGEVKTADAAAARPADDEAALEQRARTDLVVAEARLELILARKALKQHANPEAVQRARHALALLRGLPEGVDASAYELQAEGILARAGVSKADLHGTNGKNGGGGTNGKEPNGQPGASNGNRDDDDDEDDDDDDDDVDRLDTPEYRYVRDQLHHQGRVREAVKATEVRELTAVDELRVVPPGDIFYPADWPQRIARRAAYADGALARSDTWRGQDGKDWQVVIYDVSDITYVTPDFQVPGGLTAIENLYNALDRDALRQRSEIFGGYAEDLAAGIPLLNYFGGGIDPLLLRGPKYSAERQEQVVQMIDAILDRTEQPKVISVPPR